MTLYIVKPVAWNSNGYQSPTGELNGGWPAKSGYGHEEWNNADAGLIDTPEGKVRAFFTQSPDGYEDTNGDVNVIMVARNRGAFIVGVALNATWLGNDPVKRALYSGKLPLDEMKTQAWNSKRVKRLVAQRKLTKSKFDKTWESDKDNFVYWTCDPRDFHWLEEPVQVDGPSIMGGPHGFTYRFSEDTDLNYDQAVTLLDIAGINIYEMSQIERDIEDINKRTDITPTTAKQLIDARRGQGKFRRDLLKRWGGCAVTGCLMGEVLTASHIKKWNNSSDSERLNANNGIPLIANLDRLFECRLISFDDSGIMLVSPDMSAADIKILGAKGRLRLALNKGARKFMKLHREQFNYKITPF